MESPSPLAQHKKHELPTQGHSKKAIPDFGQPLTGTLFSKKFPPNLNQNVPSSDNINSISELTSTSENPVPEARTHYNRFTIVTSDGAVSQVGCKKKLLNEDSKTPSELPLSSGSNQKPFGVDISKLLDNLNSDKTAPRDHIVSTCTSTDNTVQTSTRHSLWTEKYRAKRFTDLVGDERTHRHVMHWLKEWEEIVFPSNHRATAKPGAERDGHERKKILLLHGPPGLGKTTLAHVAARQAGYEPLEINASDERSGEIVKGKIKDMVTIEGVKSCGLRSGKTQSLVVRPVCVVIDEIDGVTGGATGGGEAGFIKALVDLIMADKRALDPQTKGNSKGRKKKPFKLLRPIIAVCNDLYAPSLKPLRPLAEVVQMRVPPKRLIEERLEWILEKEGFLTEDGAIRKMVEFSSGSSGGQPGDMRGALISAQWICTKLGQLSISPKRRTLLTRKFVEDEFGGANVARGDGKRSSGGRLGIKHAVEAVFHKAKNSPSLGSSTIQTSGEKIQELVESLGEFDRITMDCFATYASRDFHDDSIMSKPDAAYEWLWFSDILSSRVFNDQYYELAAYLSYPIVAFHSLFASSSWRTPDGENTFVEMPAFTGPGAEWEAREVTKGNVSIIQSIHTAIASIRLSQTFKSPSLIVTELVPYVNTMLCPRINPVIVGGSSYGVASVRKDSEKRILGRAVNAMEATGIRFDKIKIEMGSAEVTGTGWAYRMEPPVDSMSMYSTYTGAEHVPVRYAVRQVLDHECRKMRLIREKTMREARMGDFTPGYVEIAVKQAPNNTTRKPDRSIQISGSKVKRDFFGRVIAESQIEHQQGTSRKRRRVEETMYTDKDVWVSFHEGFSNAVRKGIRLTELMDGLK
ncbi:P-loop containing nucleoside triphosphate hydrolase protein [Geopyxis carbonaria]|nr:P-loop containing nucleoside triphosphate hydrolase protein [Geopyxis carbonaria]